MKIKRTVLKNGIVVLYEKRNTPSVVAEVCVKTGSLDENSSQRGISHFLEHLLFEGTEKWPNAKLIANEIEKYGGDFNASTTQEGTYYYIRSLKKHFPIVLDILSDMMKNPILTKDAVNKNRKVIVDEINMINDDPRAYQWILFHKNLYKKHKMQYPAYGSVEIVKKTTKKDIVNYFKKYYQPNNIVISISGNVDNPVKLVKKYFGDMEKKKIPKRKLLKEPVQKKTIKKITKDTGNSYYVMGYKTVSKGHKDSHVLEVIYSILSRGQSGRLFDEVRTKRGLAYDIGVSHKLSIDTGYFAIFFNSDKKKLEKIKEVIFEEFKKLQNVKAKDIREAKSFLEGEFLLSNEDNQSFCDALSEWESENNINNFKNFLKKVKKVSAKDIKRVAKKYFTKDYCLVGIEQKK